MINQDNKGLFLTRYQIRVGAELKGGYSGITYDDSSLTAACAQFGLTPDQFESIVERSEDWELPYPALPEGEYLFFFTPEGDRLFRACLGHIEAVACALALGGVLEVLRLPYSREGLVYEDPLQVAYLAGASMKPFVLSLEQLGLLT